LNCQPISASLGVYFSFTLRAQTRLTASLLANLLEIQFDRLVTK